MVIIGTVLVHLLWVASVVYGVYCANRYFTSRRVSRQVESDLEALKKEFADMGVVFKDMKYIRSELERLKAIPVRGPRL